MKRSLSGIKPTGTPHLGNYLGMIGPAIALQKTHETFYFIANYHALTSMRDPKILRYETQSVAAQLLAFGLDTSNGAFYRQSDVPQVTELAWVLGCMTSMGDLTRAHAYKAAKDKGEEGTINLGVFSYPVLMAADIILFDSDVVPVGQDQIQHIEMARGMAQRFNHYFGETLKEPKELVQANVAVIPGTDGRKMSKSYNNGIEPLSAPKELKKQVMAIVTDSKGLEDKKDPDTCNVVTLYKFFATAEELEDMKSKYRAGGYGYGHAKLALLEKIESRFSPAREKYNDLMKRPHDLEDILQEGAKRARKVAEGVLERTLKACGIR
ncbi:MAG: tryptophan--tRNA ligase [Bdellovibrionota bacterium]